MRCERQLLLALVGERDDVGIEPDHAHAEAAGDGAHQLQRIDRVGTPAQRDGIGPRRVDGLLARLLAVRVLERRDAVGHRQQLLGVFVGEDQHECGER